MVISDLSVHREQVGEGGAVFFAPNDPRAIADCLERVWLDARAPPTLAEQQSAAVWAAARIREFAEQLTCAADRARANSRLTSRRAS
jgi:hypothetical protein